MGISIKAVDPVALAANSAFTSAYAPLGSVLARKFVPASALGPVSGSPVLGEAGTSDVYGLLFDGAGATEVVYGVTDLPTGWATYKVTVPWINAGAGTGDVAWRFDYATGFGDNESASPGTAGTIRTDTAFATPTAAFTLLETGLTVPTAGELLAFRIRRASADAGDTLTNDVCLLGVFFEKVT